MIGSFICRVLILALGHVYPAYKCYKTVELNKPEIEQLRFWCQYWILVALLNVLGAFADVFFSWLPFYYEAKLGVYLFLWYPQTNGATIVYEKYVKPYIAEHEYEIDHTLLEFRARASDNALIAQQLVASYLKTSLSEMVKYALLMMPAQKMNAFQQLQQPGQPQEPVSPSVMAAAHQPASSQQPQSEARALIDPVESSEPQEQPIKEGISLPPSPAQFQERVPETDGLQTAQVPTPTEEPIEVETSSSEASQNSDQQLEAAPIEEAATNTVTTRDSLRKRVPIATISPA